MLQGIHPIKIFETGMKTSFSERSLEFRQPSNLKA